MTEFVCESLPLFVCYTVSCMLSGPGFLYQSLPLWPLFSKSAALCIWYSPDAHHNESKLPTVARKPTTNPDQDIIRAKIDCAFASTPIRIDTLNLAITVDDIKASYVGTAARFFVDKDLLDGLCTQCHLFPTMSSFTYNL